MTLERRIQIRRDTAANWTAANPILAAGEEGYETDTRQRKVGDGATAWTSLPYDATGGGGGSDHGGLTGLADDDHAQYHTDARGDARYYTQATADSTFVALAAASLAGAGFFEDDDLMAANSALKVASQQSIVAYVAAQIAALVDSSPAALDTLNELAAALGDDPNFATTINTAIAAKANTADVLANDLFDANTIVKADADNTPAALAIPEGTIVGRIAAGVVTALTAAQVRGLLNVEDGAAADQDASEVAVTPTGNLGSSDVQAALAELQGDIDGLSSGTVPDDSVTNAKLANVATDTIKGRTTAGTGDPEDLTPAQVRTMLNVEDGADVTDATNVAAAGATMDADASLAGNAYFEDDDTMASDSALKVASVQSIRAYVATQIANLIDSSPASLDTLNELAAALGDDPNFATTINAAIAAKANTADVVANNTFDANTILKADADNTPIALSVPEQTLLGRITAGSVTALTPAQIKTLLAIAAADISDFDTQVRTSKPSQLAKDVPSADATVGTRTLVAADDLQERWFTDAGLVTINPPTDAEDDLVDGFEFVGHASGAGGMTVDATGLTIVPTGAKLTISQGEALRLRKTGAANTWLVTGGTAA